MSNISHIDKEIMALSKDNVYLKYYKQWSTIDGQCKKWKSFGGASDEEAAIMFAQLRFSDRIRNYHAERIAHQAFDLAQKSGVIEEYNDNTLGAARIVAQTEDGSPEWHHVRRLGIGGSSVRPLLGLDWKSKEGEPVFLSDDAKEREWVDLAVQKSFPLRRDEIIRADPLSGAAYRGHLWEKALIVHYAAITGKRVAIIKHTWGGEYDFQRVNLDGLILHPNTGEVEGIIECKTALRRWKWSYGIPIEYRTQVLWYLHALQLPYADIVVRYEDGDIDIFRINADETLCNSPDTYPIHNYIGEIDHRWNILQERIKNYPELWDLHHGLSSEKSSIHALGLDVCQKPSYNIYEKILQSDIVRTVNKSPWTWMPERFKRIIGGQVSKNGSVESFISSDVNPMVYPIESIAAYQNFQNTNDVLDIFGNQDIIFVVDSSTEKAVTRMSDFPHDVPIVNISAIRRSVENRPNAPDFDDMEHTLNWLQEKSDNFKE